MPIGVARERWQLAGCLLVAVLTLAIAAAIKRPPPDFAELPPLAVIRDPHQRPLWAIRVAAAAHLIAVDAIAAPPAPKGHAYQLWLSGPNGGHSLGLLPAAGRKIIPEMPALIAQMDGGRGELAVTLEPARGSVTGRPSGPLMFQARFVTGQRRRSDCALVASMSGLSR